VKKMTVLENNEMTVERLTEFLGKESVLQAKVPRERRAFVLIPRERLLDAVNFLKENEGFEVISTITGLDTGEDLEVIYHLRRKDLSLSLKVRAPYDDPKVPSITPVLNGAVLYEREIHDLIGVEAEGHPDLKRLILGEEWPEGVFPLRKEWDVKKLRERVDGEVWGRDE
jgi:NADH:ubiquinone oxidoreductase subunit C